MANVKSSISLSFFPLFLGWASISSSRRFDVMVDGRSLKPRKQRAKTAFQLGQNNHQQDYSSSSSSLTVCCVCLTTVNSSRRRFVFFAGPSTMFQPKKPGKKELFAAQSARRSSFVIVPLALEMTLGEDLMSCYMARFLPLFFSKRALFLFYECIIFSFSA